MTQRLFYYNLANSIPMTVPGMETRVGSVALPAESTELPLGNMRLLQEVMNWLKFHYINTIFQCQGCGAILDWHYFQDKVLSCPECKHKWRLSK